MKRLIEKLKTLRLYFVINSYFTSKFSHELYRDQQRLKWIVKTFNRNTHIKTDEYNSCENLPKLNLR
jgi:hypothetical protein